MRYLLTAVIMTLAFSNSALACSGTEDYPAAVKALENNQHLSAEQKDVLMKDLMAGMAIHDDGHATSNMSKMGQSLQILQTLKPQISQ
ncbi:MAG: hypothetical protein H8E36_12815 [Rhodospirillaceae bacterium]|nr:hypothetical protein [Rhodospirillaceae bacterium]